MRIAFLTHQWPGVRLGGIGAYTLNAARMLAAAGHEAHVFTLSLPEDARGTLPPGVVVHEVKDLAQRTLEGSLPGVLGAAVHAGGEAVYRLALGAILCDEVRRLHAQQRFDVLEAAEYEGLSLPLVMSPVADLPLVTHIHSGSAVLRVGMGLEATADQLLLEAFECAAIVGADGRCAPTRQVVADTLKACPVAGARVLPLPFIEERETPFSEPPAAMEGAILYIGRLEAIKGAHLLPAALNVFLERHPAALVRLAGPDTATAPGGGSMAQWMRGRIAPEFLKRVTFLGERTKGELAEELKGASFVVVPSLFESYSYVCCEAMAAGRGIVVSDGTGAADVVGDAGVTFRRGDAGDLAEKMHRVFEDRELQKRLGAKAYERIRGVLGPEATLGQRVGFYEEVAAGFRERGRKGVGERMATLPGRYAGALVGAMTRVTTVLAGVPDPGIVTPGTRLAGVMGRIGAGVEVVLYGAGRHTSRLLAEKHLWERAGHRVVGLIDDHARFRENPVHLGLPVQSVEGFLKRATGQAGRVAVVLSTDTFEDQFWEQTAGLRAAGIGVWRLYG